MIPRSLLLSYHPCLRVRLLLQVPSLGVRIPRRCGDLFVGRGDLFFGRGEGQAPPRSVTHRVVRERAGSSGWDWV